MATILIDKLIPTSGAAPEEDYDPVSQAGYSEWNVGDEARFSIMVPGEYRAGSDFFLRLQESSPSTAARHKWEVTTLLLRSGVHSTDEQAVYETHANEFVSSATSHRLTSRIFIVTGSEGPGTVNALPLTPQDVFSVHLKRVAAQSDEDPNPIKIFAISLEVYTTLATISHCAGRVGKIADSVRDLFNESTGGLLPDDFILRSINRCRLDLAQEDYWRCETWIPSVAGSYRIDLSREIPQYQRLHQVSYHGQGHPMVPLGSYQEYEEIRTGTACTGSPEYYVMQNSVLFVWPPASTDLQSGFCVYHSYVPTELTCADLNPDPAIPKAHDMVFAYYVLKEAFLRDRHAPGADAKFREYSILYESEKQKLVGEGTPSNLAVRSYR